MDIQVTFGANGSTFDQSFCKGKCCAPATIPSFIFQKMSILHRLIGLEPNIDCFETE